MLGRYDSSLPAPVLPTGLEPEDKALVEELFPGFGREPSRKPLDITTKTHAILHVAGVKVARLREEGTLESTCMIFSHLAKAIGASCGLSVCLSEQRLDPRNPRLTNHDIPIIPTGKAQDNEELILPRAFCLLMT